MFSRLSASGILVLHTYDIYKYSYFQYLVIGWFVKLDSLHDMDPPIPTCVRV